MSQMTAKARLGEAPVLTEKWEAASEKSSVKVRSRTDHHRQEGAIQAPMGWPETRSPANEIVHDFEEQP